MNHKRIQKELSAYLDDELTLGMQARIEAHLRFCGECREMLSAFQKNRRRLAALVHPAPPIKDAVMTQLRTQTATSHADEFSRFGWIAAAFRRATNGLTDCIKASRGTKYWLFRPLTASATGILTLGLLFGFLYLYPKNVPYEDTLDIYFGLHTEQLSENPLKSNVGLPFSTVPVTTMDTGDDTELFRELYLGN